MTVFNIDGINYSRFRDVPGAVYTRSGVEYQQNASASGCRSMTTFRRAPMGSGWTCGRRGRTRSATPTGLGAAAGTPGAMPINWSVAGLLNGITRSIVGTGTENGIPYVDIRFAGTATSSFSRVPYV